MATNPFDQFDAAEANPFDKFDKPEAKPSSTIRKLADYPLAVASGATGAIKALADAAGAGNSVSGVLDRANTGINSYLSPEAKAEDQQIAALMGDARAKGMNFEGVKAGAEAFGVAPLRTALSGVGSIVPVLAGAALTGGAVPAALVGGGIGAAMGAGTAKGSIYDDIKKRSLAGGMNEADATAAATKAQEYGGVNTDQIALGGALGAADALTGVSKAASGMVRNAIRKPLAEAVTTPTRGIIQRGVMGMLGEIPLEAAQGGQEQVAANIAAQRAGFEAGTWDNVASKATMEALASAGPGAAFGVLKTQRSADIQEDIKPMGALEKAASLVPKSIPLTEEGAQKQANARATIDGLAYEVAPHDTVAGRFKTQEATQPLTEALDAATPGNNVDTPAPSADTGRTGLDDSLRNDNTGGSAVAAGQEAAPRQNGAPAAVDGTGNAGNQGRTEAVNPISAYDLRESTKPRILDTDILDNGKPFATPFSAKKAANELNDGSQPYKIAEKTFVLRKPDDAQSAQAQAVETGAVAGTTAEKPAAADTATGTGVVETTGIDLGSRNFNDLKDPNEKINLYRGEGVGNKEDGAWWSFDKKDAEQYAKSSGGEVIARAMSAKDITNQTAQGQGGVRHRVFPNKADVGIVSQPKETNAKTAKAIESQAQQQAPTGEVNANPLQIRNAPIANPDINPAAAVSADAGGGRLPADRLEPTLQSEPKMVQGVPEAVPLGKEVSRDIGSFKQGRSEANAKQTAKDLAKQNPALDYSVEADDTLKNGYVVVGRERVAQVAQKPQSTTQNIAPQATDTPASGTIDKLIGMEEDAGSGFKKNDKAITIIKRAAENFTPEAKRKVNKVIAEYTSKQKNGDTLIKQGFYDAVYDEFAWTLDYLKNATNETIDVQNVAKPTPPGLAKMQAAKAVKDAASNTPEAIARQIQTTVAANRRAAQEKSRLANTAKGYTANTTLESEQAGYDKEVAEPLLAGNIATAKAILDKDVPALIQRFVNGNFEASEKAFHKITGVKVKGLSAANKKAALYKWANWTPEQIAAQEKAITNNQEARSAKFKADELKSNVKYAWNDLARLNAKLQTGESVTGQEFIKQQIAKGFDEVGTQKKGVATLYGLAKGTKFTTIKHKTFTTFLKAARDFGGLKQALELVNPPAKESDSIASDFTPPVAKPIANVVQAAKDSGKLIIANASSKIEAKPVKTDNGQDDWKIIGKNKDGKTIVEDKRGVRSYVESGIRISEPVGIRPTQNGLQTSVTHSGEFLSVDEISNGQNDELDAETRSYEAKANPTYSGEPKSDALNEKEKVAKAKMLNALGKLAQLASKNTRMNWTPEEEQKLLPIVIELFDGAMELGAVTFQKAVRYVRNYISKGIDQETADAIPFDTLQGAYIATSGRHKDKGVTPKKEVASFDSLAELEAEGKATTPATTTKINPDGTADGETRFSRGQSTTGLPLAQVKSITDTIKARWSAAPEIVIAASMDDAAIPQAVRDHNNGQLSQGAQGQPEGFFYAGKVYLIADQLATPKDVMRVLFHETLGHVGLRGAFGDSLKPILQQIAMLRKAEVQAKAKEYGLDMAVEADRLQAAEEVLANMAQTKPELGFVKRAIAAIRTWLRAHGVNLQLSDSDIVVNYILPARSFVEGGKGSTAGATAFSRGELTEQSVLDRRLSTAKQEILADIKSGQIPKTVRSFSELHDYVDANEYVNDADRADNLIGDLGRANGWKGQDYIKFTNKLIDAVDAWLAKGAPDSRLDNFKAWFGNSRVKDMTGQAATVYHGTSSDFSVFDKLKLGTQTAHHATSKLGFFFTSNAEKAGTFATGEGANVMAVKLKIENPYQMTVTEAGQITTEDMARAKREDLQKAGYDGIRIANGGIWVAFEANQIKSATGNSGDYSQSPDIRFSRSGDVVDTLRSASTLRQATNSVKDMLHSDRTFNMWERTVGTQFQKASKSAPFKRVFEAYNNQTDDIAHYAIEAERLAPSVLQRLDGIKDTFKAVLNSGAKYKSDIAAIAKPLLSKIEGEKGVKQVKYDDQSLKQIFKLNDRQIEMYKQVRLSVDTSLERLAQTYAAQMGADQGIPIDTMKDMGLQETVDLVKEYVQQSGTEKSADLMKRLDDMANETKFLQDNAYMPAMRFGNFAVTMKDGDKVAHFEMFETQLQANLAAGKLKRENPSLKVTQSLMNEDRFKMFKGVSPETVELFAQFTGMDSNEAYQDYIALAKSGRSSAKRLLEREGVAGFHEDITRVLASFVTSNARQAAMNMNQSEITAAMSSKDLQGDVQNEAQKLHQYMSDPQEEAHRLRGFLFLHFIGGSIASAAVNLTQPILQTAPYLSQFAGAKTAKIMAAAAKMAATGNITPNLKEAMARAKNDGITDPHEIHNLMADASGSTLGASLKMRALTKAWGSFFSVSEAYNRRLTFLAAYQTGLDMGQAKLEAAGFKDAYDFSKHAIIETQGLYSKTNRPNWARGAIGATLFTFKQFSISYVEFLSRLPNKQKALALGMLVLVAGLQGLPGADDLEDLIDTIGQSLGYNTNSKRALLRAAVDLLGEDLGLLLTHGVSSTTNVDLQGRLGMGNLIPGTGLFKMSEKDKTRSATELAGVTGSVLNSAMDAIAKAQKGEIFGKTGALATMSPVAIRNFLQGAEAMQTGVYTDTRGRKVQDIDGTAAFLKMLGFQPGDIAQESRKISELMQTKGMLNAVSGAISDKWAQSVANGDRQGVMDAMATLKAWNENNPDSRIILNPATIRQKILAYKMTRDQRFLKTLPKTMRAQAMEELG